MATSAGPGAVGVNIRDLCPICGKDPQKNGCLVNRDVTVCPNSGKCGNKDAENDNRRRNCTGYLCGNIGMGTFLGSNILGSSYNAAGLEPRSPYHAGSMSGPMRILLKILKPGNVNSNPVCLPGRWTNSIPSNKVRIFTVMFPTRSI